MTTNHPPAPAPSPSLSTPPRYAFSLRAMATLRPSAPRWPIAVRAALSIGGPVAAGVLAGHVSAGLLATIGAFTALYASDRPYGNRARVVGVIAIALALVVMMGEWSQELPAVAVPMVVLIATIATFLCNALSVGPPGAYIIALACAAGTAIPTGDLTSWQVGLLVLSGGMFSWVVHMAGALFRPRGPERSAVANAARAVARFADLPDGADADRSRHEAAQALTEAWAALVTMQPARPRPDGTLTRLRSLNRQLHRLFAAAVRTEGGDSTALPTIAERAREIGRCAISPEPAAEETNPDHIPLGRYTTLEALRQELTSGSPVLLAALRVGISVAVAGFIGAFLGLERAYWAMAAAVLVLHQGLHWAGTLQRAVERMTGTLLGLILAFLIISAHPTGFGLVVTIMALQYVIEVLVTRNYGMAVIFITAIALTIASGAHETVHPGELLWARGVDTVIGCAVALAVRMLTSTRDAGRSVPQEITLTLESIRHLLPETVGGDVTSVPAKRARRDLAYSIITLLRASDMKAGERWRDRRAAERFWPAVIATQRLGYRLLAICWSLEETGDPASAGLPDAEGQAAIEAALHDLSAALEAGDVPPPLGPLPEFLQREIRNLHDSIVAAEG